ncbi:hypothetical protein VOLCADRAFT_97973 [Volvox carteri f. nagariensis]|uniref:Uncharacterized protein n=1 Tax=Volvox carteri f. nagariensis TaxID=3068 RepID=D8UE44_VOLCA|nr:uncharacterized protein VOLCADRAFT_97973 [Volvox carteri f. nagariensis]EFJ42062.1 hypothetical protein VOLCADRAFT_97973 [Volvox carteri f. nagariensis]|eukprot:XP_002956937.1 hypothetical protein VOLCADRAFT_97973 [Volvox carteri f. nagariensis]
MAQVAALLVATSSGRALADELASKKSYTYLIGGTDGVPKVLLGVNGQPVLNHWLAAIQQCSRLSPLEEKVFILCNENNIADVRTWAADPRLSAGGFPLGNVLSNGAEDSLGLAADVATFLSVAPASVAGGSLLIAEADALCGPGFSVARAVEHAVMRAKDTLLYMAAPEGMALEGEAVVQVEDPATAAETSSQRVTGMDPTPGGIPDSAALTAVLAPVAVLRPQALERVVAAAAAAGTSASSTLGDMISSLQPGNIAHPPMYAMPLDCFFRLSDAYHVTMTSNFYAFYAKEKAGYKGDAARALEAARKLQELHEARTITGGSAAAGVRLIAERKAARPPEPCVDPELRKLYGEFYDSWLRGDRHHDLAAMAGRGITGASVLLGGSGGTGHCGGGVKAGSSMPVRFADATTRRHNAKEQHPVYTTTTNTYGLKTPAQADMPLTYTAASQHFTKSFPVSAPKSAGLVTAVTKSKVHKTLDDF